MKFTCYLLTLISLGFSLHACSQSFEGQWSGTLEVQGIKLPTVFEFTYNGQWEGTMQSPMQSKQKMPFTKIVANGDSIHAELSTFGIRYAGKLSADKQAITGKVKQGNMFADLNLSKGALKALNRPQEVKEPVAYKQQEVSFENALDKVKLSGTLTMPSEPGNYPAVVLLSGSGPQDRNSSMFGHEPFKVIADYLTIQGIMVLRYDDRGIGKSTGDFSKATTTDFGKDALAALEFLRKQGSVNGNKVGFIGHSEGGLIASILAGQGVSGLNFIVDLAGPALPMDSLMLLQNEAVMRAQGQELSAKDRQLIKKNYAIAKGPLPADKAFEAIRKNMSTVPGSQSASFGDELAVLVTPWYRHFLKIDPTPFIKKIKIPVFAAFGGKDVQVPAAANMESLSDHLPKNPKNNINIYPKLNHQFQTAKTGSHLEYADLEESFNPQVMKDMAQWILAL